MTNRLKITLKWLRQQGACAEGIEWYKEHEGTDARALLEALIADNKLDWANWLIVRVMTRPQYLSYAVFAAEQVIDLFERECPNDNRPRLAIEAARKCLDCDTEENRAAADAARAAAWAAADAARAAAWAAADAAAWAAAWAAADAAAWAAADAARAAAWAARAAARAARAAEAAEAVWAAMAAEAAVWAARAAEAVWAARAAADARAAARDAAWAAARAAADARAEILLRILRYGIGLLIKEVGVK